MKSFKAFVAVLLVSFTAQADIATKKRFSKKTSEIILSNSPEVDSSKDFPILQRPEEEIILPKSSGKKPPLLTDDLIEKGLREELKTKNRGPGVVGGGGGTFIQLQDGRLVFWDLFYFHQEMYPDDLLPGNSLQLSPANVATRGEWYDYRELKAMDYINRRLELWSKKFPSKYSQGEAHPKLSHVVNFIKAYSERLLPFFITSYRVGRLAEIDVSADHGKLSWSPLAVAGAYYQPSRFEKFGEDLPHAIFVDIETWNRAGLLSQAALLLHELMRLLQKYYGMSNFEVQKTVYQILTKSPDDVDEKELFWGTPDERVDSAGLMLNALGKILTTEYPKSIESLSQSRSPISIVTQARDQGILGEMSAQEDLRQRGNKNRVAANGGLVIIEPTSCETILHRFEPSIDVSCENGFVTGPGLLRFSQTEENFQIDAGVWLASGSKFNIEVFMPLDQIKAEVEKKKAEKSDFYRPLHPTQPGKRISFQREGNEIHVQIGSQVVKVVHSLDLDKFHEFSVRVSKTKKKISILIDGETVIERALTISKHLSGKELYWEYQATSDVFLRYLRKVP